MRTLLFILLLSITTTAYGQWGYSSPGCPSGGCPTPQPRQRVLPYRQGVENRIWQLEQKAFSPRPAICEVWIPGQPTPASGALIDKQEGIGIVVTAGHVGRLSEQFTVRFPGGETYQTREVWGDQDGWDLSLLVIDAPPTIDPLRLVEEAPKVGESVTVTGYGDNSYQERSASVVGYARPKSNDGYTPPPSLQSFNELVVSTYGRQGDSGAPMLDQSGRIVAILCATDGHTTVGPCHQPVRNFLARLWQRIRGRRPPCPTPGPSPPCPTPGPEPPTPTPAPEVPVPTEPIEPDGGCQLVPVVAEHTEQLSVLIDLTTANSTKLAELEVAVHANTEALKHLQLTPGPKGVKGDQGPPGKDGQAFDPAKLTPTQIALLKTQLGLDTPVFYVLHRDPKTGQLVPQKDPLTGEEFGVQPVYWGEDYTIFLNRFSSVTGSSE